MPENTYKGAEALKKRKALKKLFIYIAAELALIAVIVFIFDPFYQYHEPFFGLEKVLYDRDNQVPGTIRTFTYDSVILGSSVTENFDSAYLDEHFDSTTLKVIKASGSTADLLYYLEQVHREQEIKRVLWGVDTAALMAGADTVLYGEDIPRYLHTRAIWDDIPYLYNKEILLEKLPVMLAYSYMGVNTGGEAYNWSADKEFSAAKAMQAYSKPQTAAEAVDFSADIPLIRQNIEAIITELREHPETEYIMVFPPYSMMWWDCGYVNGVAEEYFYILGEILPALLECENATVYFYQAQKEIICDLDNYMDMIHYAPQINQYMLEAIVNGENMVTRENVPEVLDNMRETYEYIISEGIYRYYER